MGETGGKEMRVKATGVREGDGRERSQVDG